MTRTGPPRSSGVSGRSSADSAQLPTLSGGSNICRCQRHGVEASSAEFAEEENIICFILFGLLHTYLFDVLGRWRGGDQCGWNLLFFSIFFFVRCISSTRRKHTAPSLESCQHCWVGLDAGNERTNNVFKHQSRALWCSFVDDASVRRKNP